MDEVEIKGEISGVGGDQMTVDDTTGTAEIVTLGSQIPSAVSNGDCVTFWGAPAEAESDADISLIATKIEYTE